MSYQGMMLGAIGSASGAISIASMLYRQTPEYKAKAEAKQQDEAGKRLGTELERKAEVASAIGTEDAQNEYFNEVYRSASEHYARTGDVQFKELAAIAGKPSPTEQATEAMNTAKEERRAKDSWRNERTSFGMSAGELADKLGPEARAVIEKEMNN